MIADRSFAILAITGAGVAAVAVWFARHSPHHDSPARRALATWSQSCAGAHDGLCASHAPRPAPHCGPDNKRAVVVQPRSAEAAAARSELEASIATYELIGGSRHDYAMAKLAIADDELESYLALAFPAGLDFGPEAAKKESMQRFDAWLSAKTTRGEQLHERYDAILALGDPVASVIAMSRTGTIASSFADELFTAEIPLDVRTGDDAQDKIDAYCDALTTAAEPLQTPATAAFTACVRYAAEHAYDLDFREIALAAQPCREALVWEQPEQFPSLDEAFRAPELTRLRMELGVVDGGDDASSYEQLNMRGVALRIQGHFAEAHAAYERAIALDDARPEAHFNLGLVETFDATHRDELETAAQDYEHASAAFLRAADRSTGQLHGDAIARARDARNAVTRLREFSDSR